MNRRHFLAASAALLASLPSVAHAQGFSLDWLKTDIKRRFADKVTFAPLDDGSPVDVEEFRATITTGSHVYRLLAKRDFLGCTVTENTPTARLDGIELGGEAWRCEAATWRKILAEIERRER